MKRIIFIIVLFFAAIAISPILIGEKGYILIAMGNITIESTVVTATMMLVALFITLVFSLKILRGGLNLSIGTWNKIAFASQRKAMRNFNKGISAYILGDNQQAEHLLVKSAEPSNLEHIAYLLAASAADKQGLASNTKHYLAQIDDSQKNLKDVGLESVLITVQLLINHEEFSQARELIDNHHKHIGHDDRLLSLEIELSLIEKRYSYVVDQLVAARKSKIITDEKVENWESVAFLGAFNEQIQQHDKDTLNNYWNNLARKVKQREQVIYAYCQVLATHNINQPLSKILLPVVKKGANEKLLKQIRKLPLTHTDELIQAVQKHLHHDQHSAKWLSCLAHLAACTEQWPMAEKAFNSLVQLEGKQYDKTDLQTFSKVLEKQDELPKAIEVLNKIVEY
ncbi:MAG: heme biosynthesis protein HemY [Colwelliaceae bacterium]|nr:heme biosynthesis protein HemY [Colwelliaceae bacterium]